MIPTYVFSKAIAEKSGQFLFSYSIAFWFREWALSDFMSNHERNISQNFLLKCLSVCKGAHLLKSVSITIQAMRTINVNLKCEYIIHLLFLFT